MQKKKRSFIPALFIVCCCFFAFMPQKSSSADFSIAPVRIFFDNKTRTSVLRVTNESAEELVLQLKVFQWQQDGEGKDIYSPTDDIIFFPKIFKIQQGEEKIIRLGTEIPLSSHEKTYRLYMEEIPESQEVKATTVKILMRVGVPIFLSPLEEEVKGSITRAALHKGSLSFTVQNEGNSHFIMRKIAVKGTSNSGNEVFSTETGGGYLHGSGSKNFSIEIPAADCLQSETLVINIDTDKLSMADKIDISKEMCTF